MSSLIASLAQGKILGRYQAGLEKASGRRWSHAFAVESGHGELTDHVDDVLDQTSPYSSDEQQSTGTGCGEQAGSMVPVGEIRSRLGLLLDYSLDHSFSDPLLSLVDR